MQNANFWKKNLDRIVSYVSSEMNVTGHCGIEKEPKKLIKFSWFNCYLLLTVIKCADHIAFKCNFWAQDVWLPVFIIPDKININNTF